MRLRSSVGLVPPRPSVARRERHVDGVPGGRRRHVDFSPADRRAVADVNQRILLVKLDFVDSEPVVVRHHVGVDSTDVAVDIRHVVDLDFGNRIRVADRLGANRNAGRIGVYVLVYASNVFRMNLHSIT